MSSQSCAASSTGCTAPGSPCTSSPGLCATGAAAGQNYSWICGADLPAGSLASGGGILCFGSATACQAGRNACSSTAPCVDVSLPVSSQAVAGGVALPNLCTTGAAAGSSNSFVCPADIPKSAAINAFGAFCYTSSAACMHGPNGCSDAYPCKANQSMCTTGAAPYASIVGPSPAIWFCDFDAPVGASPNGAGAERCPQSLEAITAASCNS